VQSMSTAPQEGQGMAGTRVSFMTPPQTKEANNIESGRCERRAPSVEGIASDPRRVTFVCARETNACSSVARDRLGRKEKTLAEGGCKGAVVARGISSKGYQDCQSGVNFFFRTLSSLWETGTAGSRENGEKPSRAPSAFRKIAGQTKSRAYS